MRYAVIVRYRGNIVVQGVYKTQAAAENRADQVTGGEVVVFGTFLEDEQKILEEFRDTEARGT